MKNLAATRAADLQAAPGDAWAAIAERAENGEPLARLAVQVRADLDPVIDRSVQRICEALPLYRDGAITPREDLWWSLYRNDEQLLVLVAERRGLHDDELAVRGHLGSRRAQQGMPVTDLLRAFRIGYSTFWEALVDAARAMDPAVEHELMNTAGVLWTSLDETSSAVAAAHRAVAEARDVDARRRTMRFIEGLRSLPDGQAETEERARQLGFDPGGRFLCAVYPGHDAGWRTIVRGVVLEQPDRSIAVCQPSGSGTATENELVQWFTTQVHRHVGIGLARSGLMGAAASLEDALVAQAAAATLDEAAVCFRESWFDCIVVQYREHLAPLVGAAGDLLHAEQELRTTLEHYLAANGNLTTAGRTMHVHPNSVAYRLRRLAELTGLDARTPDGALLARAALAFARLVGRG